ncbi:MAG: metallophosphoesterase [Actinomycetota bacterium]|nr:metallophosphoesterase [Actinomycetota bacterium]
MDRTFGGRAVGKLKGARGAPLGSYLKAAALGGLLAGAVLLAYARYVEPYWPGVERATLTLPRLAPPFDGYRLVHISDIHMDGWMAPGRLDRIVDLINEQEPDLVAITGDFVAVSAEYAPGISGPLKRLRAPDGAVAVLGNHDHMNDAAAVRRALYLAAVIDVSNRVHTLRRDGSALHLCGVDSVMEGLDDLAGVLEILEHREPGCAVLLAHEPDFADQSAATGRFDLQLSGHSHGGQVKLPLLNVPYVVPLLSGLGFSFVPPLIYKYPRGLYEVGRMYQYTNRGLGVIYARFRLNCRPEVTLVTLRAPQCEAGG